MSILNRLRRNHLAAAGVLFAVAMALYAAGLRFEAVAPFVLAWVALLTDRSEGSFPAKK